MSTPAPSSTELAAGFISSVDTFMQLHLQFDATIYPIEAIEKAAYRFIDRFSVVLSQDDKNIYCALTFDANNATRAEAIVADFQKELLDQKLRIKIKAETEPVRNLILAYAFSKSGLQK